MECIKRVTLLLLKKVEKDYYYVSNLIRYCTRMTHIILGAEYFLVFEPLLRIP